MSLSFFNGCAKRAIIIDSQRPLLSNYSLNTEWSLP
jgi:hypothetical protein